MASILLKTALEAAESEGFPMWHSTSDIICVPRKQRPSLVLSASGAGLLYGIS